jgi:hypothetical protein
MKIKDARTCPGAGLSQPFSSLDPDAIGASGRVRGRGTHGRLGRELWSGAPNGALVEAIKPLLNGADALASQAIWRRLYAAFRSHGQKDLRVQALSGIEMALWISRTGTSACPRIGRWAGPCDRGPRLCHRAYRRAPRATSANTSRRRRPDAKDG